MSQQVNLILPGLRPSLDPLSLPIVTSVAAVIVVVLAGLVSWESVSGGKLKTEQIVKSAEIEALRQQIEVLGQGLSKRAVNPELAVDIDSVRTEVAQRQVAFEALASAEADRQGYAGIFHGFSTQAVSGVWLTGFVVDGEGVEIRGRLTDSATLPTYIAKLNESAVFAGKRFAALSMQGAPAAPETDALVKAATAARPRYTEFTLRSSLPSDEGVAR